MLDWLRNFVGPELPESTAVSRGAIEALAEDFKGLNKHGSGLAARTLRYVVDGEPLGLLSELAAAKGAADTLAVQSHLPDPKRPRRQLYADLASVPPDVLVRLGKVLETAPAQYGRYYPLNLPQPQRWVDALARDVLGASQNVWPETYISSKSVPLWEVIEPALKSDSLPPFTLVRAVLPTTLPSHHSTTIHLELARLDGFAAAALRHVDTVRSALRAKAPRVREHALDVLKHGDAALLEVLADDLVALAADGSKQVRFKALALLERLGALPLPKLRALAVEGNAEQRALAVRALWTLGTRLASEDTLAFVRERRGSDSAESVRVAIDSLTAGEEESGGEPTAELRYEVPVIDQSAQLSDATATLVREYINTVNEACREAWEKTRGQRWAARAPQSLGDPGKAAAYITGELSHPPKLERLYVAPAMLSMKEVVPALERLLAAQDFRPVHMLRLVRYVGGITPENDWSALGYIASDLLKRYYAQRRKPGLLELALICETHGVSRERFLAEVFCQKWGSRALAKEWQPDDVWPLLAHDLIPLEALLSGTSPLARHYWFDKAGLFEALRAFPSLPPRLVPLLFETALGSGKTERPLAQHALERLLGKEETIIAALADGKGEKRAQAASWLGRLRHAAAAEPIKAALRKEKNDVAQAAMLGALEALGQPLEAFVGPDKLDELSRKALAKGLPAELDWFPWAALPPVRWAKDGRTIPAETVKGLVAHTFRLKAIEPSALLRRYAGLFEPADRERLGQLVLDAWLKEDARPVTREVAEQNARNLAQQAHQWARQYPDYHKEYVGKTEDELFARFLPDAQKRVAGSAIGSKGLLALAAACCGAEAAPAIARYLKEYYGTRAAQGRALIQTLAWIEHPSATQLMLSVGNRFRTKGFQDEAMQQAQAMAERKGWTLADLADRTVSSAGFDEDGVLELDYGPRSFKARLTEDLGVELLNEEGKKVASLPEPRKEDDEAKAKEAKKRLSSAKKELKTVVAQQTDRFYEALCTERTWRFDDWERYLNRHPLVRKLVQRLVWIELQDGKAIRAFRPLDDGTLTGLDDEPLTVSPDARVGLAHDSRLDKGELDAWQKHLADYEVKPLFQQLGKGIYVLPQDKRDATDVEDFRGHVIDSFALRGRATKLGYTRGAAGDGGWFAEYEKRFPTLGVTAVLEFTGSPLPEEQRKVALVALRFERADPNLRYEERRIPLGEVPAVLVSECYHDLRLIAAEGSGFDPEWQKTVQY